MNDGSLFGAPLQRAGFAYFQIAAGRRFGVRWIRSVSDVEELLLDSSIRRVYLAGHASMHRFVFGGLTGRPEETLSRFPEWLRRHSTHLAPHIDRALRGRTSGLAAYLNASFGITWRALERSDFDRIASHPEFRKKERVTLYTCSGAELRVSSTDERWSAVLREVLRERSDTFEWLDVDWRGDTALLGPLVPRSLETFQSELPSLLRTVANRVGGTLRVEAEPNFADALADDARRFPGTSWIHDFIEKPEGRRWSTDRPARARPDADSRSRPRRRHEQATAE